MPTIRIWALESDNDAKAVRCLANKLVAYLQLGRVSIQTVEGKKFLKNRRIPGSLDDKLKKAVQNFVNQDEYVIFVIDTDSPMSLHQRRQEPNSYINQIERIVRDRSFAGKVFFVPAVYELEAWLLIDCLGIFCYFASKRSQYKDNCRDKVSNNSSFARLVKRYQTRNTEKIVETEIGGEGPKEYLEKFSERILRGINPNMPQKNIRDDRYHEKMSPGIAEHVVIDRQTLAYNNSLNELGNVLSQFK